MALRAEGLEGVISEGLGSEIFGFRVQSMQGFEDSAWAEERAWSREEANLTKRKTNNISVAAEIRRREGLSMGTVDISSGVDENLPLPVWAVYVLPRWTLVRLLLIGRKGT